MEEHQCQHVFSDAEQLELRSKLLRWYEKNKRELPWRIMVGDPCTNCAAVCARSLAPQANVEEDDDVRAYGVLVSEVMLQQASSVQRVAFTSSFTVFLQNADIALVM